MWSNLLWPIGLSHLTHLKSSKNAQFKHIICHLISQPSLLQPSLKNTANIIDKVANINWAFSNCLIMLNIVHALSIFIFITTLCDKSLIWLYREDMNLSKWQKIMEDRGAWHVEVDGIADSDMTEQLNNTMKCYWALKKDKILPFAAMWMALNYVMLSEVSQ